MLDRIPAVGENVAELQWKMVELIQDDAYIRLGDKWYLPIYVSDEVKRELDTWRPQIRYLKELVICHLDVARHLQESVTEDTSEFQHIVIANHASIASILADASELIRLGSLANSLTLLRPAVEAMIDIQYLKRYPEDLLSYHSKVVEHNSQNVDGEPIPRHDPTESMRFKNTTRKLRKLREKGDLSQTESDMVDQFDLLSNVAEHPSPERLNISLVRQEWNWKNTFGELQRSASHAIKQLFNIDDGLGRIIENNKMLRENVMNLSKYGTASPPLD